MKIKNNILVLIFIAVFMLLFVFNDLGVIKLYQLNNKKNIIRDEIDNLIAQEIKLTDQIQNLSNNDEYLKNIARNKFHLVQPGEKIYKVIERKNIHSE